MLNADARFQRELITDLDKGILDNNSWEPTWLTCLYLPWGFYCFYAAVCGLSANRPLLLLLETLRYFIMLWLLSRILTGTNVKSSSYFTDQFLQCPTFSCPNFNLFIAADLHRTPTLLRWSCMTDRLPYRPRPASSRRASFVTVLLLMAGDVEYNPVKSTSQLITSIKIGCLNCRSAMNKMAVLHDMIHDQQLDMILLSETWFTTKAPSSMLLDIAPSGFSALHVVRPTGAGKPSRGGRLAAVFRQSIPVHVHPLADKIQPSTFEFQLLRVGAVTPPFTVANIYRPHSMGSVASFVDELADIITSLTADCADNIVLCGDLNCPGIDDSSVDVEMAEGFECLGNQQLITEPTLCVPGVSNLFDVLATSNAALVAIFGAKNANLWWFLSLSFLAENDVAFSFLVSFLVETHNENTEIHYTQAAIVDQFNAVARLFSGSRYNGCNLKLDISATATCSHHPLPGIEWRT